MGFLPILYIFILTNIIVTPGTLLKRLNGAYDNDQQRREKIAGDHADDSKYQAAF